MNAQHSRKLAFSGGLTVDGLRQAVIHTRQKLNTSERRICAVLDVSRSSLRYLAKPSDDDALRLAMIRLAKTILARVYLKLD